MNELNAKTKSSEPLVHEGLEGVIAARTALSDVDGERGRLVFAGHDVEALAGTVSFESVCALLLDGALAPSGSAAEQHWRSALGAGRVRAATQLATVRAVLGAGEPMDALRASIASLPSSWSNDTAALLGASAVFVAADARVRAGKEPVAPDASRGHAEDYLRMMLGTEPEPRRVRALEAYLVTVAEHGMNASTFAARVVASTGSDTVSALAAAVGALKGPLHGGAPGPVLDMLDAIGSEEHAVAWLSAELSAGRRIMGMGHRVYRVRDPRAAVLERAATQLEHEGVATPRLRLARAVERAARDVLKGKYPARSLEANVEFYTAVLLDAVQLERAFFAPTFAVSRTLGWIAHVREQQKTGRLVRPASLYTGTYPPERLSVNAAS